MPPFQAKRVVHSYIQINSAAPDKVFPLLCPVREADWVPDWEYRLIYSQSGLTEKGCVFTTPAEGGSEIVWIATEYDPANFRVGYVWVHPGLMTVQLAISLALEGTEKTKSEITYIYTGLSPAGNQAIAAYDSSWFQHKMHHWEQALNCYLETGRKMGPAAWQ